MKRTKGTVLDVFLNNEDCPLCILNKVIMRATRAVPVVPLEGEMNGTRGTVLVDFE